MNDYRWWQLFPELERSFKQVFVLHMIPVFVLLVIVWKQISPLWAMVSGSVVSLMWCAVITSALRNARAQRISVDVQEKMLQRQMGAQVDERRLLPRSGMDAPSRPVRDGDTMEMAAEDYGR